MRDRIRIERPVPSSSPLGAGSGDWVLVDEVWAEVMDTLPSRAEKLVTGINASARPARVRMRWRDDVKPNMRFVMGTRIMDIVGGPAELGRRELLEFMVVDYGSAGNAA